MRLQTKKLLAVLLVGVLLGLTHGREPLRIGVILPGRESTGSANWNEMLAARAWELGESNSSGLTVELLFRDGGTTPANTHSAMDELVSEGVHAIVCCVTRASSRAAAAFVDDLPVLALADAPVGGENEPRPLSLPAGTLAQARAMALDARGRGSLGAASQGARRGVGLMTSDNDYGKAIAAAVVAGLLEAGLPLTRAETYPPGAEVLTPEALLVAASEPGSVVVWGLPHDTATAIAGLRARGFDGPVYLPGGVAAELPGRAANKHYGMIRVTVPPVALAESLPPAHPNSAAVRKYTRALQQAYGTYYPSWEGALAFDALELLMSAAELAVVYGVDPASFDAFRQALHDALVAMGPVNGAAGSYDYDGRSTRLALTRGVVIAVSERGRLLPAEP